MKRKFSVMLVMGLILSMFTACTEKEGELSSGGEETSQIEPIVVQIAYENHPGEPIDIGCNEWARLLEEKSGGQMVMEVFPSSQLGSKVDLIDQMQVGSPVITLADGAFYAERGVSDFGIVFGPYLLDTWDEAYNLVESDWHDEQVEKLADKGLRLLSANWIYGDRHLLTTSPVRSVEDLKGMKIRVPGNDIQVKGFQALGATPTPMALGEVYTALQQGTIDGFEQPAPIIYAGKYHEAAKYLTKTAHVKNLTSWICGSSFFETLTEEQKDWLIESGNEAGFACNEEYFKQEEISLQKLQEAGVEIIEIDQEEFKAAAQSFYEMPEFTSVWTEGLYETVSNAKK